MRNISLAFALFIAFILAGCSSSSSSTVTSDETIDEPSVDQTDVVSETPDDNDAPDSNPVEIDTPISNPLDGIGAVQRIGSDFGFLEGPVYSPSDNSLLFSDIPEDTIFQLQADGSIEAFRENQPTNGLLFDAQNRLLIATHSGRTLSRLEESGDVTVLADNFEGALLNSPNDIALHSNGDMYFTDPPFGIDPAISEVGCAGVYRLTADGNLSRFWCNGIDTRPNGIALSPNQDRVYVSFSFSGEILSWPLMPDGSVGEVEMFATTAGSADGGTLWGEIGVPEQVTNCTFGGPGGNTLFITGRTALYTVELM